MSINIVMPTLSPTMETGNLAKWHVKQGDKVDIGDVIVEIETDKAVMEVEAIEEGTIGKIYVPEGAQNIKVNSVIAVLLEDGEDGSVLADAIPEAVSAKPKEATPDQNVASASPTPSVASSDLTAKQSRPVASPLARRLAKQHNLDLGTIVGSAPNGRIIKRDIEAIVTKTSLVTPSQAQPTSESSELIKKQFSDADSYEEVPHSEMRRIIASRISLAKQTIPHFYLEAECQIDDLLRLRQEINASATLDQDGKPRYKISVNDMIIKALAIALQLVPQANVTWMPDAMLWHKHSNVGVAVAIPDGLITPVVREAEDKSLVAIANEMIDFIKRAKARKLLPHEYQGGSTCVSNLGPFGISKFTAVINPPQSTILAIGSGVKRAIIANDQVVGATVINAVLSCDHRAVDGAIGAMLLNAFRDVIAKPVTMLL